MGPEYRDRRGGVNGLGVSRGLLEAKRAELEEAMHHRQGIVVEKIPDDLDEVRRAAERELAVRSLELESDLLRQVRTALQRIDQGVYGVCLQCDEEISPKRLAALPWTPYCIRCQEQVDQDRIIRVGRVAKRTGTK